MGPRVVSTFLSPMSATNSITITVDEGATRFVAGENHVLYGSLRKGGAVSFLSRDCAGLCAATFASYFSYNALQSATRPMLATQLKLTSQELLAIQRLVELPMALSFLVGMLSDCHPILGLRRKAYLILGLLMNVVATVLIGCVSLYVESQGIVDRSSFLITLVTLLTSMASVGIMFSFLCVHTRTIELSQQEPLTVRGSIQAGYLICRRIASIVTGVFTYALLRDNVAEPQTSISIVVFLTAAITMAPLPIIFRSWDEELYSLSVPLRARTKIFWKVIQQKAVWRTIEFISFFALFLSIKFADSNQVILKWAGAANDNTLLLRVIADVIMLLVIVIWRFVFMNRTWRSFFMLAPVFQIVPALIASALVAYDGNRDRNVYRAITSLTSVSDAITSLSLLVPLTEIVQEGSEGATVGLVLSLQRLILIFVNTNQQGLFQGSSFYTQSEVDMDNSHVHSEVFASLILNYGLNALSIVGLFLLPLQKLDAQQMRMYGGFTKLAPSCMVAFACLLALYSMGIGIMTFIPATACAPIIGGHGC